MLSADLPLAGADGSGGAAAAGPAVSPEVLAGLAQNNNAFAFDLYQALCATPGSLFFSPFSISAALSMTYAGAAGRTAQQMADVLHFALPDDLHHAAFGELIGELITDEASSESSAPYGDRGDPFTLNIANSLWGQEDWPFRQAFLDTLADCYDSPLRPTQFGDAEGSRQKINEWVSEHTQEKIKDLLPPGSITGDTCAVLANAIYFYASWRSAFTQELTRTFHAPDGDVNAEMIAQTSYFGYAGGEGYQAIELPYVGGASMVILLPAEGQFASFEAALSAEKVQTILSDLRSTRVHLTMPQFECRLKTKLSTLLGRMGMADAFSPRDADFSDMAVLPPDWQLWIDEVFHEAWISVDKEGTEAAAATAVVMCVTSSVHTPPPPVEFTADRPFIYLIRDQATNTTLFVGRLSDASALSESDEQPEPDQGPADPTWPVLIGPEPPGPGILLPVIPPVARVPEPPAKPPAPQPMAGRPVVSLRQIEATIEQTSQRLSDAQKAECFQGLLVVAPKAARSPLGQSVSPDSAQWRLASSRRWADATAQVDLLDLHPARRASLPGWMCSVLQSVEAQGLIVGFRGVP
jgi:serpin B